MRKIKVGDIVVAKKRVGEVRQLLDNGRVFVYFPYVHETDQMILSGYEQHWNKSDLRVANAAEKKDFKGLKKALEKAGGSVGKRRFELIDPSVNARKFWEIQVDPHEGGFAVTTSWGRIGVSPSQKIKKFSSSSAANAFVEKTVKEKEKKGYREVSGKKASAKKASKKAGGRGKKCAHCGAASKAPTDCPEPWEHDNFKGGCSCAWCKANALLTTVEINWLAKHGWSSAQIKVMNDTPDGRKKARVFIKAGKHKKPGAETRKVAGELKLAKPKEYRKSLVKHGVCVATFDAWKGDGPGPLAAICDLVHRHVDSVLVREMMEHGRFTDGKRDLLVIPPDADYAATLRDALRFTADVCGDEAEPLDLWMGDMAVDIEIQFKL